MGFPVDAKMVSFSQSFSDGSILMAVKTGENKTEIFRLGFNQLLLMRNAIAAVFTLKEDIANE